MLYVKCGMVTVSSLVSPEGFLRQHAVVGWLLEVEVMEQSVSLDANFAHLLQPLPVLGPAVVREVDFVVV